MWVWILVFHTKRRTQIEGVWEEGAEEEKNWNVQEKDGSLKPKQTILPSAWSAKEEEEEEDKYIDKRKIKKINK